MNEAHTMEVAGASWNGGASPFAIGWNKLMMWLFIITDALLFAGLVSGYGFVRLASPSWPAQSEVFHLEFITLMTFILISSSATMASAVGAAQTGRHSRTILFLALTIVGGLAFLGCQAYEWTSLIREGASLTANPWGVPLFSASFFVITGFHGSHVLSGVVILLITVIRVRAGRTKPGGVELAGLYWHFVDLVWVFIFTFFYLI